MNLVSRSPSENPTLDRRAQLEAQLREASALPEAVPLSFAQQRLWVLDQLEPNSALYNVPLALELTGELDVSALEKALNQLVLRHEVLRTRFESTEDMPVQVVEETGQAIVVFQELTHLSADTRDMEAGRLMREEVNRPFDLSTGPLMRVLLLRLESKRHWLLLNFHHIVSDEWSLRICLRELTLLYDAFHRSRVSGLPELPIQYADYALWQRERLSGGLAEKQLAYWRQQLQGTPAPLELPTDFPRPATPAFRGKTISRTLSARLHRGLKDLAGRSGTSLFMVLLAAFKALLHRYTQQTDIVVGSPIAGRNQIETEDLIGFFVNTLVLRTAFAGDPTFSDLLRRVRETTLGAYANQDLPFERLVEALRPERTLNHNPFTRLMFAVQNGGLDNCPWPGLKTRLLDVHTDTAKFDLTLVVQESESGLVARAEFNSDLFRTETIECWLGHFETLLNGIVADPEQRLSELPLLTEAEQRTLLFDWNATACSYPDDRSIPQLFEAQAERTPLQIAVSYGSQTITYAELNARANQLARHLVKLGVAPDVTVGLCMERSPSLIVGMLAILKAGGAYVPLDPSYPKPRLAHMLNDSRAAVLLTQHRLLSYLPRSNARVVCFNSDWDLITKESRENLPAKPRPDNLAYVMYTSGSTGQPKGVAIPHRAIARLVLNTNYIQLTAADRIGQASNTSFDAATFEVWGALLNGARLVGISMDVALSPADFARELREQQVSVLFLTTALFNQIAADQPDAFGQVRVVMFGGEAADAKWVRAILQHRPKHLLHVYGPTENTTFSTWHEVDQLSENAWSVPIGRPLANSQCYVLDANLKPVPVGVPGELYVGGDGLARGYWNQPELTAQKFIWLEVPRRESDSPSPAGDRDATGANRIRLYKTGDLVRWLPNGAIEFIGRTDHQIKLRGFRVELGEVESVLTQHSAIRECVVTVCSNDSGDRQLVAYFVPTGRRAPGVSELRQFLKQKLPDYMVPSSFVKLEALPLTPNGKIDRQSLPKPERARPDLGKRYATPEDAVEVELTRIWENVLGIKPVGIEDKFFELGGHSLLAVRVIAQIEKQFGRKLKLATIFQAQTIEQLAAILRKEIQEDSAISGTSIVEIQPKGTRPPLFLVHGAGGGMFWGYVNLSRHLGQDQPVFGLRSRGLDGRDEFPTIEQMAEQYLADIRVVQPRGPYHIGGYCFGGNVAYEMARQLEARGEQVRLLALFNCAPANSSYSRLSFSPAWFLRFGVNLCYWAKYFLNWTPDQRREFLRWKREMLQRRINRFLGNQPRQKATVDAGELVDLSSFNDEQRRLWGSHIHALVNYHPKPFSGRVHLFRSPGHPMLCSFENDYGWGGLARDGVDIRIVPGVHEKILEEPCVESLAGFLSEALNESAARFSAAPTPTVDSPMPISEPAIQRSSILMQPAEREIAPRSPAPSAARPGPAQFSLAADRPYSHYFTLQAERQPEALALRFLGQDCTYAELNARANQLAHRLQALGIGRNSLVAVCLERSLELPLTLLAVLKAGAAYLPLDRSYPTERLAYMLQDSGARVLITHKRSMPPLAAAPQLICLDDPAEQQRLQQLPATNPDCAATADDLAYVIYTSGSTGKPKGVEITHRSMLNHNFCMGRVFKLTAKDRVLQFSPYSFDISIEEIFPTWLHGAALVMRTDDVLSSTERFFRFVREENLSVLNLPTAYWHELVEYSRTAELPPSLRLVVIGGERASDEAWRRWKSRAGDRVTLINTYGPTETTVSATLHIGQPHEETLPIGRPLDNVHTLILDANLQPVPEGETGELFIGGAGVARGYLNRPELTEQKFIRNPFAHVPGERLYRTGDLVRLRQDGELEFVGRADEQVKIRGYRIELGEIESALRAHPDLKEAVVIAREDAPGKKQLVAYYIPRDGAELHVNDVRHFLKDQLPSYMVPAAFVGLESFPMTPGGKVDRKALPPPGDDRPELDSQYAAPRTPLEEIVAGIWAEVLRFKRVGIEDNFFDLGGHSLLATQVISRMREKLQVELPLGDLFDYPTVTALAGHLSSSSNMQPVLPVSAMSNGRTLPLTPAQWRLWFLDLFEPEQLSYNITTSIRLKGPLNVPALERSLTELVRRHEALRAIFSTDNGQPVQIICEPSDIRLAITDLSHLPACEREERALAEAAQEGRKSYVTSAPMLRPFVWKFAEEDHLLLLMTHELACDGASVQLMFEELSALYEAFSRNAVPQLPAPTITYSELTEQLLRDWKVTPERIEFWRRQLAGAPPALELPADRPRPKHQSEQGACHTFQIDAATAAGVEALAQRYQCELSTVLLTAFQALLSRYTCATDIVVGFQTSRRTPAWREVIANFDNTAPVRGNLSGDPAFVEALARVRESHQAALAHSEVPFETLVRELKPPRDPRRMPIVQVMFTCDPMPLAAKHCGGLQLIPSRTHNQTSKLDLWLYIGRAHEGLTASFEYSTALFDADRIERMTDHFLNLLRAALENPERRLSELPLLGETEKRQLREWERAKAAVISGKPAHAIVLDANRTLAPIGIPGEVFVRESTTANSTGANHQEHVPAPDGLTGHYTRTGELGRWRADGTLEILAHTTADQSTQERQLKSQRRHRPLQPEACGPVEQQLAAIWREVLGVPEVDLQDDFFELGGDSMSAVRLISRAREAFKVDLPLYSAFEAPTIEALAHGLAGGEWTRNQFPVLPLQPAPRTAPLPALPMQAGLWFIDQLEPGNPTYNVPTLVRLEGALDVPCLTRALDELVRRHEALRTRFEFTDGKLTQVILPPAAVELPVTDFSAEADAPVRARNLALADANHIFDLARGPLLRCRLIRMAEQEHWFVVVMHHAISDGCSVAIFFSELEALYNAGLAGTNAALPELPVQYADYAHWHNLWMNGPLLEKELNFWKERLTGAPTAIALPTDFPEAEAPSRRCQSCFIELPQSLVKSMNTVAQRDGCTPYMLMMSALSLVMRKWTGQSDLVIGAVAAGRNRREIEDVIGCFINFMPIHIRHGEESTGQELVQRVKAAVLEAQAHQDCPFEKIVEAMNPERRQLQNPLYNVTLLLQNFARIAFDPRGLKSRFERLAPDASPVDLEFEAEESENGISVKCDFRTDLFRRETAEQLLQAFRETLETLVDRPEIKLDELSLPAALVAQARESRSREAGLTLAIAATFTAEPLEEPLRFWAAELELPLRPQFAGYNQVFQELLTPGSLLSSNARGLNVLLVRPEDWIKHGDATAAPEAIQSVAQEFIAALRHAAAQSAVPFLVVICPRSTTLAADAKRTEVVDAVERLLAAEIAELPNVHVVTPRDLTEPYSVTDYYDVSGDELGHVPYTPAFFTALGTMIVRKLHVLQRAQPKVIVLDCDNTLWSGVCGEDGADGICLDAPRKALQEFMRAQFDAGRLLAVCSKNNEEDVREVFAKRLDMPLRHEHFAAWRTNWLPKSENLKSLAQELNLGLDGFVFVDDNPVECAEVEANCPQVQTLLLPDDPKRIPGFLRHCWIFDSAKLTAEDRKRTEMYRENRQREQLRSQAQNLAEFIASLKLEIVMAPATSDQLPRVAQLTHRTNQFNCTTIRRSESEIQQLAGHADIIAVTVRDRFGDYGLVGVVICGNKGDKLDVETFLLSCRVLGRGVEHAILARLGSIAVDRGLAWVDIHFHRSEKNKPALEFLQSVGADYRQALNGGFIYRFPSTVAATIAFRPEAAPAVVEPQSSESAISRAALSRETAPILLANRFRSYRTLALERSTAAEIHAAIESKVTRRSHRRSDYRAPETDMERQLCELWQQLLRIERVGQNDNFFELGGHSLLAVRLFAELEKLTGRKFPLVTIFQAPTVRELAQVLSESRDAVAQSPIVPVQLGGSRPPLFLAHGAGGDVLWGYANLAKHLSPEQPIYGIKSRGQIGLEEFDRIEDMARYYIGEVRKIQPHGPYFLGGYCLGGNVAYEMARQLRAQGEEVALVALIDAFPSNAGYERATWWQPQFAFRFLRNVWYWLDDFKDLSGHEQRRFFARKGRILGRKLRALLKGKPRDEKNDIDLEEVIDPTFFPEHELKFWEIHIRALVNHVEQPYPGAVTLIRTRGQPFVCSFADDFCWGKLARGGVNLRHIPGSHENIFIDPNVRELARVLDAALAQAQKTETSARSLEPCSTK